MSLTLSSRACVKPFRSGFYEESIEDVMIIRDRAYRPSLPYARQLAHIAQKTMCQCVWRLWRDGSGWQWLNSADGWNGCVCGGEAERRNAGQPPNINTVK